MIRWGRSKTRKTTQNICTHRLSHACELSTSLDPVGGKSNYSKRDRKLSQSRSNPSIYIARLGASADERKRRREWKGLIAEGGDESWGRSTGLTRACKPLSLSLSLVPPLSFFLSLSISFFFFWCGKMHTGNSRWLFSVHSFLLVEIFALSFSSFFPPISLSIRLHFSQCAKCCNRIHVYTCTFDVHMWFLRPMTWM